MLHLFLNSRHTIYVFQTSFFLRRDWDNNLNLSAVPRKKNMPVQNRLIGLWYCCLQLSLEPLNNTLLFGLEQYTHGICIPHTRHRQKHSWNTTWWVFFSPCELDITAMLGAPKLKGLQSAPDLYWYKDIKNGGTILTPKVPNERTPVYRYCLLVVYSLQRGNCPTKIAWQRNIWLCWRLRDIYFRPFQKPFCC